LRRDRRGLEEELPPDEELVNYQRRVGVLRPSSPRNGRNYFQGAHAHTQHEGILPWVSPRLQRIGFFASLGLIPIMALSPCRPSVCSAIIFAAPLIGSFIYAGLKTNWLRNVHKAPLSAKIAGAFNVICGLFLVATLLASVAIMLGILRILGFMLSAGEKKR
jgi:hypothetical protein